jgi:hypothetical protein
MNSRRFIRSSSLLEETGAEYQVSIAVRTHVRFSFLAPSPIFQPKLPAY